MNISESILTSGGNIMSKSKDIRKSDKKKPQKTAKEKKQEKIEKKKNNP
jgi:hypothetical protein